MVQENFPLDKFKSNRKIDLTVSSLQYVTFHAPPLCCTAMPLCCTIYAIIGSILILRGNNTPSQKRKGGCLHFRIILIYTFNNLDPNEKNYRNVCPQGMLSFVLLQLLFLLFTGQSASALPRSLFPTRISQFSRIYPTSSQTSKYIVFKNSFILANPVDTFINW